MAARGLLIKRRTDAATVYLGASPHVILCKIATIYISDAMPSEPEIEQLDSTPPDGGYGWLCVAACFMINFATWGAVAVRGPPLPRAGASNVHDLTTLPVLRCLSVLLPQ